MKLFIRAHDLGVSGIDNVVARLNELGLDGVQLVAYKVLPDVPYVPGGITQQTALQVGNALAAAGKQVALIGAYFNPVHSDKAKVARCKRIFMDYIDCAQSFGCGLVGSETGSFNDDKWTFHPQNRTDEALATVVDTFRELADHALQKGVCIAMEGAFGHVCYDVRRLQQAVKSVDRPNVRVIFDLFNYLDVSNADRCYDILEEGLAAFGRQIEVFHIKDFDVADGKLVQRPVGRGVLDFHRVLRAINDCNPNANLVLEGTVGFDVPYAVQFLRREIQQL